MKYSIIFLVEEESAEFSGFFDLIYRLFEEQCEDFEVLIVANGTESFIMSWLNSLKKHLENLRLIIFQVKVFQALCIKEAMRECSGNRILTLSTYQELTPASYEKLICSMNEGVDFVVPYRKKRKDAFLNRFHSRFFNMAIKWALEENLKDIGCNVRFFRREVLESLELYGNMYRYISALAMQKGFNVKEVECDPAEKTGVETRYYNLRLYLDRSIEIFNLFFSTRFSRKPLRFFNTVGVSLIIIGVLVLVCVGVEKVIFHVPIGMRSLMMLGVICFVGGAQISGFGLLGEIISFVHGRSRKEYLIEKII